MEGQKEWRLERGEKRRKTGRQKKKERNHEVYWEGRRKNGMNEERQARKYKWRNNGLKNNKREK